MIRASKWETATKILGSIEHPEEGSLVYIAGVHWVHINGKWRTFDNIRETVTISKGTTLEDIIEEVHTLEGA